MARKSTKPFILQISGRISVPSQDAAGVIIDATHFLAFGDNDDPDEFDWDEFIGEDTMEPKSSLFMDHVSWAISDGLFADLLERMKRDDIEDGLRTIVSQDCGHEELSSFFRYMKHHDRTYLVLNTMQESQLSNWIERHFGATLKAKFLEEQATQIKAQAEYKTEKQDRRKAEIERTIRQLEDLGYKVERPVAPAAPAIKPKKQK